MTLARSSIYDTVMSPKILRFAQDDKLFSLVVASWANTLQPDRSIITAMPRSSRPVLFLFATTFFVLVWSAIRPHDYFTWFLEVVPALVGAIVLTLTWQRLRFTTLAYSLIAIHMMILMVGGHYTYAAVPLFNTIRDAMHLARNDYDRVGHFAQGFVPAILAREILIRQRVVTGRKWLFFIVVSICLAISAAYELFECITSVVTGAGADAFLGTQGDPWDTQEDMATALVGAVVGLLTLSKVHDAQIERLKT